MLTRCFFFSSENCLMNCHQLTGDQNTILATEMENKEGDFFCFGGTVFSYYKSLMMTTCTRNKMTNFELLWNKFRASDGWEETHAIDSRRGKLHNGGKKGESKLRRKTTVFSTKQQYSDSQYRWPFILKKHATLPKEQIKHLKKLNRIR